MFLNHLLLHKEPIDIANIAYSLYKDPYFRLLLDGNYIIKFNPKKYGLETTLNPPSENLVDVITYLSKAFKSFDSRNDSSSKYDQEKNAFQVLEFYLDRIDNATRYEIFERITLAASVIKTYQIERSLGSNSSESEFGLSMIRNIINNRIDLINSMCQIDSLRTQYQCDKIKKIIERIDSKQKIGNHLFVICLPGYKREFIFSNLQCHFPNFANLESAKISPQRLSKMTQQHPSRR